LGGRSEEIARNFLIAGGYRIEALNWRKSRFEIDIVASRGDELAFIEVKSSRKDLLGPPELRVDKRKQKRIAEAASEYLSELKSMPENIRFDVISILWRKGKPPEITHIESAFELEQDY
jgi:putative endonuclease